MWETERFGLAIQQSCLISERNKMDKIKVVWLCHFSNDYVQTKLRLHLDIVNKVHLILRKGDTTVYIPDYAIWITNGIREMEKISEVELHVISPYPYLRSNIQEFNNSGIFYHFYRDERSIGIRKVINTVCRIKKHKYLHNRHLISKIIKSVQPEIVHLFGAENFHYALSILDVPLNIITIAQLQTLLNDEDIIKQYPDFNNYQYRADMEKMVLNKVNYIGTTFEKFRNIIHSRVNGKALFLNIELALAEPIMKEDSEKIFDFVYFAANINKAADLAIEAFGIAYQEVRNITLDIVGTYDSGFKHQLDMIIKKYGIQDAVTFEGHLATHKDVIQQIRKSRFALIPLRTDLTSCTIREAMSNGLPVLTTNTGELGTQMLNRAKQSVLISPIGDHHALANNMIRIIKDAGLADTLRDNAFQSRHEAGSNELIVKKYLSAYKACLDYRNKGIAIPIAISEV